MSIQGSVNKALGMAAAVKTAEDYKKQQALKAEQAKAENAKREAERKAKEEERASAKADQEKAKKERRTLADKLSELSKQVNSPQYAGRVLAQAKKDKRLKKIAEEKQAQLHATAMLAYEQDKKRASQAAMELGMQTYMKGMEKLV